MSKYDHLDHPDKFDTTGNPRSDWTATQRAAYITKRFLEGGEFTTAEITRMLGYSHRVSTFHLLNRLSVALPLVCETVDNGQSGNIPPAQRWRLLGN